MKDLWGLTARGICEFEGKILLLKVRSKSSHDAEKWEIPGGKVKKGEFFDQALKREFLEETGLEINIDSLYNVIQNEYTACKTNEKIKSVQLIMKVSSDSDEVKISAEHDDYRWFTPEELKELIDKKLLSKAAMNSFDEVKLGGKL
ncbi:NUDIX hydrolase [Methanobrevibacter sp.]|uniref:NUDIX hydrolase n=1 Tax=Methanobrevibacter sp. TaxID=66852 RepID=UPI00388F6F2F